MTRDVLEKQPRPWQWTFLMGCMSATLWAGATATSAQTAATDDTKTQESAPAVTSISLTIDYGDGMQKRFPEIDWESGTVADALRFAERHPRGIKTVTRGSGETAFLEAIDNLANEGANGKNWMFMIDGELAKQSFGATEVEVGADVLWVFRPFE
jgi:hypothetical protein